MRQREWNALFFSLWKNVTFHLPFSSLYAKGGIILRKGTKWITSMIGGAGCLLVLSGSVFIRPFVHTAMSQGIDVSSEAMSAGRWAIGIGLALLVALDFWLMTKRQKSGNNLLHRVQTMIRWTGLLSVAVGTFYVPWLPWYMLGEETEAEISAWGISSVAGGVTAYVGSWLLSREQLLWRQILLVIGSAGMLLIALAQVLPIYSYMLYWGRPIAETNISNPTVAGIVPMLPHVLLFGCSIWTLVVTVMKLAGKTSAFSLNRKQFGVLMLAILFIMVGWLGYDAYLNATWVLSTHPVDGSTHVSTRTSVSVKWAKPMSNGGMIIRYADDPNLYTPGTTSFSREGMTFSPEKGFLPGKKVTVEVLSGRRTHTFSFVTADR